MLFIFKEELTQSVTNSTLTNKKL